VGAPILKRLILEAPLSGPGPVTNKVRRTGPQAGVSSIDQLVGDYANLILQPWATEVVKMLGESTLANGNDATADAIRFVQSLIFIGGGSNRSAEEIRAAQAACGGPGEPGGAAVAGDGRRFEIRCRRQQSFAALVSSLNSGDLSDAQQAYSSLSQLQRFANPNRPFGQAMSQIGQALQNGDLPAAQQALSSLQLARGGTAPGNLDGDRPRTR
jgi:hypothetical protein